MADTLSELVNDFSDLGLISGQTTIVTYDNLVKEILVPTEDIGRDRYSQPHPHPSMQTELGSQVLQLIQSGVTFRAENTFCVGSCPAAEKKLLSSISPESVEHKDSPSPLIFTMDDVPVAIAKSTGAPTVYALITDPATGLIAKTFGYNGFYPKAKLLPKGPQAHIMPYDTALTFHPIRFSAFSVSVSERQKLRQRYKLPYPELKTSHEDIVLRAAELMRIARAYPDVAQLREAS